MKQHRALLGNLVLLAALCLGLLFATWRPLLAPWVNDEPRLIANALDANAARQLARQGLVGNFTVHYGPLPTWIYQGLLAVTHDISSLLVLHAVLFYGATVGAMWCVGRAAGLPRAFVGVVGVSPVVCYYSRALWDNSMLVPLSLAILAAYAGWLASPTRWRALGLTLLCGVAASIHFIALPLVAAVAVHAILRRRAIALQHLPAIGGGVLILLVVFNSYLRSQWPVLTGDRRHGDVAATPLAKSSPPPATMRAWTAAGFAFTGATQLLGSASHLPLIENGTLAIVQRIAVAVTWMFVAACATGLILAAVFWLRRAAWDGPQSSRDELALLGLLALLILALLLAAAHSLPAPHYFNGTFGVFAFFAWIGLDKLADLPARWRAAGICTRESDPDPGHRATRGAASDLGRASRSDAAHEEADSTEQAASASPQSRSFPLQALVITLLALGLAACTVLRLAKLSADHGTQSGYGPAVVEQLAVLRAARKRGERTIATNVRHFQTYAHGLRTLARLEGLNFADQPARQAPSLAVLADDPRSGRLRIVLQADQRQSATTGDPPTVIDLAGGAAETP